MALTLRMPRASAPHPVRTLPAEDLAAIEVESLIHESRLAYTEATNDAKALEAEAVVTRTRAQEALARRHFDYPLTTLTTAYGWFALLAIGANWTLERLMFADLGMEWYVAALLATVTTAGFAGLGALAMHSLRQSDNRRILGGVILLGLVIAAAYLVPVLAHARAQELYGDDIVKARSTLSVIDSLGGSGTASDQLRRDVAAQNLPTLLEQQAVAEKVAGAVLAITLTTEVLLAGYGFDLWTRRRATRLGRKALRLDTDAVQAREEAAAEDTALSQELTDVARRYAITIDRIGEITRERLAAMQAFRTPLPPGPESAGPADTITIPAPALAPAGAPTAVVAVTPRPTPALGPRQLITEAPVVSAAPAGVHDAEWDGAWA